MLHQSDGQLSPAMDTLTPNEQFGGLVLYAFSSVLFVGVALAGGAVWLPQVAALVSEEFWPWAWGSFALAQMLSLGCVAYLVAFNGRKVHRRKSERHALHQSDAMFRAIFVSAPVGIFRADADGNCRDVNPCYGRISGQSAQESLGQGWWRAVHPDDRSALTKSWLTLLKTGTSFATEFRMVHPDLRVVWVSAHAQRQIGERGELTGHVCTVADVSAAKVAEESIARMAFCDALTGLPNRRLLMDRLTQATVGCIRTGSGCALFFLDLDHFKQINDTLGHDHGDVLLQQVATRLKLCIREGDTVARLGGDEFVLILENLSANQVNAARQSEVIGEKILASLNVPYVLAGREVLCTASIGVTFFNSAADSADELMKRADLAMYQAKATGSNALCLFDPEMQHVLAARVTLEHQLRLGLREKQFFLCYQPQVDDEGKITGAEAFVRWRHPERGIVSPASFIPLAEETGLIVPLDVWVLNAACQQLALWSQSADTEHLTLSVKVSAQRFRKSDFVAQVCNTLEATQAPAKRLRLQLNESLLMQDVESIIDKTLALQKQGVGFSLADLGTGYSSLSHLKRLSLEQLRVDQTFVRGLLTNPNDAAVTRSIFALAESLGITVSAEGIETKAQRDALAVHGCVAYQGYFFSHPLMADGFERLLEENVADRNKFSSLNGLLLQG